MSLRNPLPRTVKNAQELRKRSTEAETILWNALRNRKFHGLKFRRQVPIGRFIADFLCTDPKLIIELDGEVHDDRTSQDKERTDLILQDFDIPIVRFTNKEIQENLKSVLIKIKSRLVI